MAQFAWYIIVLESEELMWISIVIVVTILVLVIALVATCIFVIRKRRQSLLSLHHHFATDDHPIYKKVSPIEILQWYAEAQLGEITADEGAHQYYERVDLDSHSTPLEAGSTGQNVSLRVSVNNAH